MRFFSGNSGATLTAQQPYNNVVRSTIQCLGAVLGGAQSIHVMGYDEAYELPSEEAVTLSLRTQQIIALESGVARTADPLAGSYFVEWLTDELERRAGEVVAEVERAGGAVAALAAGIPQRWIAESAYRAERETGRRDTAEGRREHVRGRRRAARASPVRARRARSANGRLAHLAEHKRQRNADPVRAALSALSEVAAGEDNVMPALVDAARAGATVGEMCDVLRREFGEFREPAPW